MNRTQLLKYCTEWIKGNDWWDLPDHLFELGYNCHSVGSYIDEADSKGHEQIEVYQVEPFPGAQYFFVLYFAICYGVGCWDFGPYLLEMQPYQTTRYKLIKNWSEDD